MVKHWSMESDGLRRNSSLELRVFLYPMLVTRRKKNLFLYFFTELKTYYLSYSFYKNDNDDYNDMIMLITMIMLTRTNDNGYDKDNYRDPWGQY